THWHGDHTGGNVEFGEAATIIAHANVRERLSTPQDRGGRVTPAAPDEALPVVTFEDGLSVHLNGEEIRAFHVPHGHTDGDAVIWFTDSNVVHMGDDFFAGRFPFVDLASGGSVEGLERGIGSVLEEIPADAVIIPGHGPVSDVDDLRLYHRMLGETIAMVRQKMEDGRSAEEIQAEGVGSAWDGWGEGFISTERWLETIYRSLEGSMDGDYQAHGHAREHVGDAARPGGGSGG
ncbi:MAG: MBL fold metallo-hydrolase, partial [Gemmatimonadota bacterium]|nr:MBL fold metallo-hydrolase [Gemmatimonadota bacterium]